MNVSKEDEKKVIWNLLQFKWCDNILNDTFTRRRQILPNKIKKYMRQMFRLWNRTKNERFSYDWNTKFLRLYKLRNKKWTICR